MVVGVGMWLILRKEGRDEDVNLQSRVCSSLSACIELRPMCTRFDDGMNDLCTFALHLHGVGVQNR